MKDSTTEDNINTLNSRNPVKSSGALNRLNSLSDKFYQGEYSPRNIPRVAEPYIDSNTAYKIMGSVTLFMIGLQLRRSEYLSFVILKLLWLIGLLSYFYLFPPKSVKSLQRKVLLFFALRGLSSAVVYSFVTGSSFPYEFHVESQEQDTLVNLSFTMLTALLIQREKTLIKKCFLLQLVSSILIMTALQGWFHTFDVTVFSRQFALFAAFVAFCQLMFARATMDRDLLEATISKNYEDISQELNEIKTKLEEESQVTAANALHTSEGDELVMKLKYLKFSLLQKEKEKTFLRARPVFANARRKTYVGPCPGPYSPYAEKKSEELMFASGLLADTKNVTHVVTKNDLDAKWNISAKDCDNLLKLILEKQVIMWYPEVLKTQNNQVCRETAEFLKRNFTEVGNSLLSTNIRDELKQPPLIASTSFDSSPWSNYLESNICTWNFDMMKFKELTNGNHMIEFGSSIMKKFNTLKTLNTTPAVVTSFLRDVSDSYLPNAYHNSIHGADVANALGYFLVNKEFGDHFTDLEKSCLIISGLVHDLGHPGLNNAFLVSTMSTEALIYNDQSVLENFHTASFFKILQKSSSNILANLSEKDYKYFRKLAINIILDTDLTKHFVIVSKFKNNTELKLNEESDRFLSLSIALKCADVSHGAKELTLHKKWSRRITEEFFYQGDKERENNIPVTPLCDRKGNIPKSQQGFLNFIVLPLFEVLDQKFFNEEMKKTVTEQIKTNLKYWSDEIPKEECNFMIETEKILEDIANEAAIGK